MHDDTREGGDPRPLGVRQIFGLDPLAPVLADARSALVGDPHTPPNRWGPSTVRIFKPWISIPTWLGRTRRDRRLPVYNFFNRVPQPPGEGYSVRVTYCRDWRGGRWTYDGHLGTDFACPVGTPIVASAPGRVLRVACDIDKGGLKVCIDHGGGLFTTSNHLARALVAVGDRVARGQTVGLSGASGMEFVPGFPWISPHLHFNVWLAGEPSDPFALEGSDEEPLWRAGTHPEPARADAAGDDAFEPTEFDVPALDRAIASCKDPALCARMQAVADPAARAAELLVQRNYRPTRFESLEPIYAGTFPRRGCIDLPFRRADFVGVAYPGYPP